MSSASPRVAAKRKRAAPGRSAPTRKTTGRAAPAARSISCRAGPFRRAPFTSSATVALPADPVLVVHDHRGLDLIADGDEAGQRRQGKEGLSAR